MALAAMFGADQVAWFRQVITNLAKEQGVGSMVIGDKAPNTRRALAVAEFARERGELIPFKKGVMDLVWRDGENIEDEETIRRALEQAELPIDEGLAARHDPTYLQRVAALRDEAHQAGVTGIPTLIYPSGQRIVGAQRYEEFEKGAIEAGAVRQNSG